MIRSLAAAAVAAALIVSMPAFAQAAPSEAKLSACKATAAAAENIMKMRQMGVPVVKLLDGVQLPQGPARDDFFRFVREAYAEPSWNSPDLQRKAATDFSAAKYVECMGNGP